MLLGYNAAELSQLVNEGDWMQIRANLMVKYIDEFTRTFLEKKFI